MGGKRAAPIAGDLNQLYERFSPHLQSTIESLLMSMSMSRCCCCCARPHAFACATCTIMAPAPSHCCSSMRKCRLKLRETAPRPTSDDVGHVHASLDRGSRPRRQAKQMRDFRHARVEARYVARSNTPTKKYDVITICSDGRSEGELRFVLIHIESLRSKIQVFSTRSGPTHCFFAVRGTAATTGAGMATGDALQRGQAAIRRSNRRTHLKDVTAHWATAARGAALTPAWSCLADACADGEMASH
eukprot:scaffold17260_cov119-Isochrysis_galbana.AAC.2